MDKRVFGTGLGAGLGAVAVTAGFLVGVLPVMAQKPLYVWPLGVEGYTYRNSWPRGVEQTLDTIICFF